MTDERKPKAVFVIGPESSGTRLTTRLLIRAGCIGSAEHQQPFDGEGLPHANGRDVVWRRSLPHGGGWPPVFEMIEQAEAAGYEARVVFLHRATDALTASQLEAPHVKTAEEAEANIARAYEAYYTPLTLGDTPLFEISYEQLCDEGWGVVLDLLRWLDLSTVFGETLIDGQERRLERSAE